MTNKDKYPSNSLENQEKRKSSLAEGALIRQDNKTLNKRAERLVQQRIVKPPTNPPSVKIKKPGFLQKLTSNLISRESDNIGDYVLWEVLIPAAKTTIQEGLITAIEMIFHGGAATGRRSRRDKSHISYGSYYGGGGRRKPWQDRYGPTERDGHYATGYSNRLDGIYFEFGEEADGVLEELHNLLDRYEQVSIADYYELAGIANMIEPTDHGWGWTSLSGSRIVTTRHGFMINLPRYELLDV